MTLRKFTGWLLWLVLALSITAVVDALAWKDVPAWLTPVNTVLTFAVGFLHAGQRHGWRRASLLLVVVFVVGITFESVGVATGKVYGPYHYTDRLGPKVFALVPVLIPVAWFMMMYASLTIADLIIPHYLVRPSNRRLLVAAAGGVAMTAWDLAMDPLMVAGDYWVWDTQGAYFGIPLQNFWGWWLTTFTALFIYQAVCAELRLPNPTPTGEVPLVWAILIYGIVGGSSVVMNFVFGLGGAGLTGLFAMLPWAVAALLRLDENRR
jgi:putative membrane protein